MAESFDVEINLVDGVTRVAKRAAEGVKGVEGSTKETRKALDGLGKQFEKVGYAAEKARIRQNAAFERSVRSHLAAVDRMEEKLRSKSFGGGFGQGVGFDRMLSASFWGSIAANGVMSIVGGFVSGAEKAVEIFASGVKDAFMAAGREETARVSERNIFGEAGGAAFRDNVNFSGLTPFSSLQTRAQMLRMRRAGLSQGAARQALATANDIGGPDEGAVSGVLDAFQKIYTQKGVTKRQLKELLGDVGQTIPDFFTALGKKLHVDAKSAEKLADKGGVDPQLIMNMITEAVNKRQGGIAGTGGARFVHTLAGEWKKLNELPDEYYQKLADSPGYHKAVEAMGGLLEKLSPDSEQGQRILGMLEDMFGKVTNWIGDPADTASKLADNIEEAIGFGKDLVATFSDMAEALLPSLDTVQEMLIEFRKFKAYTSGTDKDVIMADEAQADFDQKIKNRGLEKDIKAKHAVLLAANIKGAELDEKTRMFATGEFGPVDITAVRRNAVAKTVEDENKVRRAAGSTVHMTVNNNVSVNTNGEDANEAHEKAGHEVRKHLVSAAERAKAEIGG